MPTAAKAGRRDMEREYTYKEAWEEISAQVRKLGFLADVLEDDESVYFGSEFHERWVNAQVLIVVSQLRRIEKLIKRDPDEIPF